MGTHFCKSFSEIIIVPWGDHSKCAEIVSGAHPPLMASPISFPEYFVNQAKFHPNCDLQTLVVEEEIQFPLIGKTVASRINRHRCSKHPDQLKPVYCQPLPQSPEIFKCPLC